MSDILGITPGEDKNYRSTLAQEFVPTSVRVGSAEKFVPNINASKWADECWFNFKHDDADLVANEKETFTDGKIDIVVGDRKHSFYELDANSMEYEIVFASQPASNTVGFALDFPKGLEFIRQKTLTEYYNDGGAKGAGKTLQQFLDRSGQLAGIAGGYNIYWSKKNNQYQTGKFGYILRPTLTDANRQVTDADIFVDPILKRAEIALPGEWMGKAVYPVTLGPTLGYSTEGSSWYAGTGEKYGDFATTDATGGDIDYFHCYCHSLGGSGSDGIKLGCYNAPSSGANMVGESLIEQVEFDLSTTGTNETAGAGSTLSASTRYCIAYIIEHADNYINYDGGGDGSSNSGLTYASEMSDPGESGWNNALSDRDSIWLIYNPAVGGGNALLPMMMNHDQLSGGIIN